MPLLRPVAKVALLFALLFASTALAERTVWLVRPLYPGQEALVERTEKALDKLIPAADRANEIVGVKELAAFLKGKAPSELPCLTGDTRCADPIDPFVAALGIDRVVMVQGGQDGEGFKYRVVSYRPASKETNPATASSAILEKALLGAVAKVVPVASNLEVKTAPLGATVYIDDVKVGTTPLSTQVLPGERVIRLDLKLHQPLEETMVIPIRGAAKLEKTLEKVAARIVITASPAGTSITVDGTVLGKDKVDRGITPGTHTIRLSAEGHKAFEQSIDVKAEEQYQLDKTLEPIPGVGPDGKQVVIVKNPDGTSGTAVVAPPQPPPPPPTETEQTYGRTSYFFGSFEWAHYDSNRLTGRRFGEEHKGRTEFFTTPGRSLYGASGEYGIFGRYFGLTVFGVSYLTNIDELGLTMGVEAGGVPENCGQAMSGFCTVGTQLPQAIQPVKIHLVTIRAIQPQFRMAFWKFQVGLQAGFEFRVGQIIESQPPVFYNDGFLVTDLLISARLNARFLIYEGLFMFGSYNYTWFITGQTTEAGVHSAGSMGLNVGVGYSF